MRITLERINTKVGRQWANSKADRLVRIIGAGWYWRKNRAGYTDDGLQAGVYTLRDALDASSHCGPEKHIVYDFLPAGQGEITQPERGKAQLLLQTA